MSIGRSQALAIADGFLDSVGSGDDEFRPRETYSEIIVLAGEFIEDAQSDLNKTNSNASGKLSASLVASEPEIVGGILKVDVLMNYYGQFVNKGVKGTQSGSSTAGYAFKTPFPNKKMVASLIAGISRAKASTRNVNRKKTISANEKKNSSISDISKAYGAARNIKMFGIAPRGFLEKAVISTKLKVSERMGLALQIDVIKSLTQN